MARLYSKFWVSFMSVAQQSLDTYLLFKSLNPSMNISN